MSHIFKNYLTSNGIHHHFTCPHHLNKTDLRKCCHLFEIGLTLLAHASIPITFWVVVFHTVNYLINHLPTKVLHNESPFKKLFSTPSQYAFFKVFGCACFPCLRPYNQNKLQFRSKKCIFLGYLFKLARLSLF